MVQNKPKITVITVTFNSSSSLESTIESVINQDYPDIEYILIDGGSTDGTIDLIKKYQSKINHWVSERDDGIYYAMNKGIFLASGQFINFMNSGDSFYTNDVVSHIFSQGQDADIIYGDAIMQYPTFQTKWKKSNLKDSWKEMPFCHQASFVNTSIMKSYKFDARFKLSSDFDFLYRAALSNKSFKYVNKVVCLNDNRMGASLSNGFLSIKEREMAVLEKNFSVYRFIYFKMLIVKLKVTSAIKKLIGEKPTSWLTKFLRG
jgi:glycosyltransferase involved in cell wall biosynthesis